MTNERLFLKQMIMLNNFLNTGAMSDRDYEKSAGGLTEKMGYLIKDTTKEERIALIKSWIPDDEAMDGSDVDLWDMYADYINGTKEISECNEAFKAEYYTDLE